VDEGVEQLPKWLLPTLSEVLALHDPTWIRTANLASTNQMDADSSQRLSQRLASQRLRAEREWSGAIAALNLMLQEIFPTCRSNTGKPPSQLNGMLLSGPLPVLSQPDLLGQLSTWTLTAESFHQSAWMPFLLPASQPTTLIADEPTTPTVPLLPGDPLAVEQFCLVLTHRFSLVLVLGENLTQEPAFMFSFMPEVVQQAWETLRPRILLMAPQAIDYLDHLVRQVPPVAPDYQTVMQFSRLLLEHLPEPSLSEESRGDRTRLVKNQRKTNLEPPLVAANCPLPETTSPDVELLQAIAHEVRTPLTTIRTLTRSLLKRTDLPATVVKRLQAIDRECSEQIDRFGLFFRAVELETSASHHTTMPLTRTSLADVLHQSIPRWQQQANQRQLILDVSLPQQMPMVVSDPTMLDQALTSLIERFTRRLPAGSHIQVEVAPAGNQLKVQLQSQPEDACVDSSVNCGADLRPKSLGQLLTFQPETGSLSLNLAVTKNLFQALGGKLIVKHRPQQGEVMTVFLPLELGTSPLEVDPSKVLEV
jgi:hypothetical protein